jgi:hypothetical protein
MIPHSCLFSGAALLVCKGAGFSSLLFLLLAFARVGTAFQGGPLLLHVTVPST